MTNTTVVNVFQGVFKSCPRSLRAIVRGIETRGECRCGGVLMVVITTLLPLLVKDDMNPRTKLANVVMNLYC